ncbi:MAG: hypothetical protein R3C10_03005 [Pirellulales bacterium]|nr:hypothetical protein [Planctomycetales bacterium]
MMKRLMFLAVAAAMLSLNSGCYLLDHVFACCHGCGPYHSGCNDCDSCGSCGGGCGGGCVDGGCVDGGCASCGMGGLHAGRGGPGGPYVTGPDDSMGGVVTYPYYTVRGPRDYLAKAPRSIGP